ncbi:16S rRNA (guanine(966)-N(2))-methyltransferase RsmD [Porticoccus sp. W117]|uniref:16S rRNA (guanine(966)-N(2))-methyltransferase RsmD n=1 Tax=Porticoccus sp. W117 TaxID=3054777 RepID=UPI002593175C|nr:16S rRNA (guanine(966)-N(2))-methyltransferase RsmD [Porticoccus sp. W117]MDM3870861.1 16S rRNA (guanine(966)-N(2))-methyltransferase RsmD [Porticoccus sp. W117]
MSTKRPPSKRPSGGNQLRIIGGQWRGRKLSFPDLEGLRPTGDRVRETLFNWLSFELPGAHCLDLFAGSGALGLEALSRGAAHTVLVEKNPSAARQLKNHCQVLDASADVEEADALCWLQSNNKTFDVVFLDPPFGKGLLEPCCALLAEQNRLKPDALIYMECAIEESPMVPAQWQLHREKQSGQVNYRLYRCS